MVNVAKLRNGTTRVPNVAPIEVGLVKGYGSDRTKIAMIRQKINYLLCPTKW